MKQDWKLNINDAVLQFQRSTLTKVDNIYKNKFRKLLLAKYGHNWEKYCDFFHKRRVWPWPLFNFVQDHCTLFTCTLNPLCGKKVQKKEHMVWTSILHIVLIWTTIVFHSKLTILLRFCSMWIFNSLSLITDLKVWHLQFFSYVFPFFTHFVHW